MADFARSVKRAARANGELAAMPGQGHRLAVNHRRPAEAASVRQARENKAIASRADRAKKLEESQRIHEKNLSGTPEELEQRRKEMWAKIDAQNARIDASRAARREALEKKRAEAVAAPRGKATGQGRTRRGRRGIR